MGSLLLEQTATLTTVRAARHFVGNGWWLLAWLVHK